MSETRRDIDSCVESALDDLKAWYEENPDATEMDLDDISLEFIESATPIYYGDVVEVATEHDFQDVMHRTVADCFANDKTTIIDLMQLAVHECIRDRVQNAIGNWVEERDEELALAEEADGDS